MSCPTAHPTHPTYCPLCREPLTPAEVAACPADEYPTHYVCRVAIQARCEEMDAEEEDREYRRQKEEQP